MVTELFVSSSTRLLPADIRILFSLAVALVIWCDTWQTLVLIFSTGPYSTLPLQVAFTRYGEEFRRQRRLMSRGLAQTRIPQYHPLICASIRPLLRSLLASSGRDFVPAIRRYAGGLNLNVVYGLEATRDDDPAFLKVEGATNLLANRITAGGGLWAVDILPFCPRLPPLRIIKH